MLKNLTKYDFLWTHRVIVWYMLAALVCGVFSRITGKLYNDSEGASMALLVLDKIASVLLIVMCIALFMNVLLRLMARFVNTLYKDQSYFTHTLPARRETVFDAKAISGAAAVVLSLAVIALALYIGGGSEIWESVRLAMNGQKTYMALMACVTVLQMVSLLYAAYFGFILGYRFNTGKAARAVVFSLLIYFALQNIIMAVIFAVGLLDKDIGAFFLKNDGTLSETVLIASVQKIVAAGAAFYLVADVVLYLLGRKALAKGVNVD